jgi:two-component system, cell cycle response regulator CtrA
MRILIADPDPRPLAQALQAEGFQCETTDDADDAVSLLKHDDFDMLLDGVAATRMVRAAGLRTPILYRGGENPYTRAALLDLGVDAFAAEHPVELCAQAKALVRRSRGHVSKLIRIGNIVVDLAARSCGVIKPEQNMLWRVPLSAQEYKMLELLALRKGVNLSKHDFMRALYTNDVDEPEIKIIDVYICKLRKKLAEANAGAHHIATAWGIGYHMTDDPLVRAPIAYDTSNRALRARTADTWPSHILRLIKDHGPQTFEQVRAFVGKDANIVRTYLSTLTATGRLKNTGRPTHAVYALTAKGADRLAEIAA